MVEFGRHTLGIILSDFHLGHEFSRIQEIENFLKDLLHDKDNGELPFFKMLIILGDFFDLIATDYEALCTEQDYIEIYRIMEALKNRSIEIIFILGNHETNTTGIYNIEFDKRKLEFLENFRNNGFEFNFLEENSVCQYLILANNLENEIFLILYGSKWEDPFRIIPISKERFSNGFNYLMVHGYQFEYKFIHHIFSPIWEKVKTYDNKLKKSINKIWQGIKFYLELEQNPGEKNARYYKNIINFNENCEHPFTHVIFGHTHEGEKFTHENLKIINCGCWMYDKNPNYIKIYTDGTSELFEIKH